MNVPVIAIPGGIMPPALVNGQEGRVMGRQLDVADLIGPEDLARRYGIKEGTVWQAVDATRRDLNDGEARRGNRIPVCWTAVRKDRIA